MMVNKYAMGGVRIEGCEKLLYFNKICFPLLNIWTFMYVCIRICKECMNVWVCVYVNFLWGNMHLSLLTAIALLSRFYGDTCIPWPPLPPLPPQWKALHVDPGSCSISSTHWHRGNWNIIGAIAHKTYQPHHLYRSQLHRKK